MKKIIGLVFISIFLIAGCSSPAPVDSTKNQNTNTETKTPELIGGQTDEHGCLGPAGYSWCAAKNKCLRVWEEYCGTAEKDPLFTLLTDIKSSQSLAGGISDKQFQWDYSETFTIDGLQLQAEDISKEQIAGITNYFKNNGFTANTQNSSADSIATKEAYEKGSTKCVYVVPKSKTTTQNIAQVSCGIADKIPMAPTQTLESIIQNLFAQKYNKPTSDIIITISKQDASHARGSVNFVSSMEGGNFLAAKVSGKWQLVFDGNGLFSCTEMAKYKFPKDMIADCY